MEITKMNIISDFVSPLSKVPQVYVSFWRWGALIIAVFATFTSLFTRIKLYILRFHSIKLSSSHHPLQQLDHNFDCSDDDENNETTSVTESIDDELDSDEINPREYKNEEDIDFSRSCFYKKYPEISNSEHQQRRFSGDYYPWPEFAAGRSVVKHWDSLGVGLEFIDYNCKSEVDICDDGGIVAIFGGKIKIPAGEMLSPAVMYLAEVSNGNGVGGYDRRMRNDNPVIYGEWGSRMGNVVGVDYGGVEKVYVKYYGISGGACTIGDLRNFRNPLES